MYTSLPFFNYSPQLYYEVLQAGLSVSECSILRLLCFKETAASATEKLALKNFELWTETFLNNSNQVFQSGTASEIKRFSEQYINLILSYLLVASLYDYKTFIAIDHLNKESFVRWFQGTLMRSRLLSQLL